MPRKYCMSWQEDKKRWRKMYKGQWYFISAKELNRPGTAADSWDAANQWWRVKVQGLPNLDAASSRVHAALQSSPVETLLELVSRGQSAAKLLQLLSMADGSSDPVQAATRLEQGVSLPSELVPKLLGHVSAGPGTAERETTGLARLDAIVQDVSSSSPSDPDRSIRHHVSIWTALQMSSKRSNARKKMNIHHLGFFAKFLGNDVIDAITEDRWTEFFQHVQKRADW